MKRLETAKALSPAQPKELLKVLRTRFEKNVKRHQGDMATAMGIELLTEEHYR